MGTKGIWLTALICAIPLAAFASDEGNVSIRCGGGFVFMTDIKDESGHQLLADFWPLPVPEWRRDYHPAYSLGIECGLKKGFSTGLSVSYVTASAFSVESRVSTRPPSFVHERNVDRTVNFHLVCVGGALSRRMLSAWDRIFPYLAIGLGYNLAVVRDNLYVYELRTGPLPYEGERGPATYTSKEHGMIMQASVGADIEVSRRYGIFIECSPFHSKTKYRNYSSFQGIRVLCGVMIGVKE